MPDELKKLAECPVCLGRLIPAAIMCTNGHAVCQKCQEQVNVCPTCRGSFSNIIKNTLLNQMLEYIPVPCKNKEVGCDTEALIRTVEDHEKNYCYFREDKCCGCHKTVPFCKLSDHLIDHMNDTITVGDGCHSKKIGISSAFSENADILINMKRFNSSYSIRYIHEEKAVFVQRFFQNWERKTILFSLQFIGKKEEANKYSYEIKIDKGFQTVDNRYFTCSGLCMHYCYSSADWKDKERVKKLDLKQIFLNNEIPEEFCVGVSVLRKSF